MGHQILGVYAETAPGEARVALVPRSVRRVHDLGLAVLIETGAGTRSGMSDLGYANAGATVVARPDLFHDADILVGVRPPNVSVDHRFRPGQALICLLRPLRMPDLVRHWANQGLLTLAVDLLPPGFGPAGLVDAPSPAYAEVVAAVLEHLVRDGRLVIDLTDPVQSAIIVTHRREVLDDAVWRRILGQISLAGLP